MFSGLVQAANLQNGIYRCNDGGMLSLKRSSLTTYYANLSYPDHSSSTLDVLDFQSTDSLVAIMYPDDEGTLGQAVVSRDGRALHLNFSSGEKILCER